MFYFINAVNNSHEVPTMTSIKLKELTFLFEDRGTKYYYKLREDRCVLFYKRESNAKPTIQIRSQDMIEIINRRENERRAEESIGREDSRPRVATESI